MNYELCKKLKEAGFKQDWSRVKSFYYDGELYQVGNVIALNEWKDNPDGSGYHTASDSGCGCCSSSVGSSVNEYIYVPTFTELIEACGDGLFKLKRCQSDQWETETLNSWGTCGSTPEEAVANLWLALNTKP